MKKILLLATGLLSILILVIFLCVFNSPSAEKEITIFHTNDIESVYDPVEAFWNDDIKHIGGIPQLATLIKQERKKVETSFLFDSGDIFTGALSKKTYGKIAFDIYDLIGYDAIALGNHEFEYGWKKLREVMPRASFSVLNNNIIYEGSDITLTKPYTIIERNGVKVGVIGVMGVDAFLNTMLRKSREGLDYLDPIKTTQKYIDLIRDDVDVVVVLTHQNKTAPMQTDKENDPSVQRGFDEDYAMAGALKGADVILGGHSDNGLWQPVVHEKTGTIIGLTFGQGKYLGEIKLKLNKEGGVSFVSGRLIPVVSDKLKADKAVQKIITDNRASFPELSEVVGKADSFAFRSYNKESNIGNLIADILRKEAKADLGVITSGTIRYDINAGDVSAETLHNVYPFKDYIAVVELKGKDVRDLFEYSYTLPYGILQASGVESKYDLNKPKGSRILSIKINGQELDDNKTYKIATYTYLATGGDSYTMLTRGKVTHGKKLIADIIIDYFKSQDVVKIPEIGKQQDMTVKQ